VPDGNDSWRSWFFPLLSAGPRIAAIVLYWWRKPRDGTIPQSMADQARKRLWT
jgi:hypothetical protein